MDGGWLLTLPSLSHDAGSAFTYVGPPGTARVNTSLATGLQAAEAVHRAAQERGAAHHITPR